MSFKEEGPKDVLVLLLGAWARRTGVFRLGTSTATDWRCLEDGKSMVDPTKCDDAPILKNGDEIRVDVGNNDMTVTVAGFKYPKLTLPDLAKVHRVILTANNMNDNKHENIAFIDQDAVDKAEQARLEEERLAEEKRLEEERLAAEKKEQEEKAIAADNLKKKRITIGVIAGVAVLGIAGLAFYMISKKRKKEAMMMQLAVAAK